MKAIGVCNEQIAGVTWFPCEKCDTRFPSLRPHLSILPENMNMLELVFPFFGRFWLFWAVFSPQDLTHRPPDPFDHRFGPIFIQI